jgi:muramidase (phage lysozyme)
MTMDEIDVLQFKMLASPANRWNSSALGRYQFVRTRLQDLRGKLGIGGGELYDEDM